jgi:hypothetical protein
MVMGPVRPGTKNDFVGGGQQQLTRPTDRMVMFKKSFVTVAWIVLRFLVKETISRYEL